MDALSRAGTWVATALGRESLPIRLLRPVYEAALDASTLWHGVAWSVNGEPMRIDPRVRRFVPRLGEPEVQAALRSTLRAGEIVLDVGSFLGVYAVLEARWVGPAGRVIAVEPTVANHRHIHRHLALNGVSDRVTVIRAAVGAEDGSATLFLHDPPFVNRLGAADSEWTAAGTAMTPVRSVDSLCQELGVLPDLIRMDIQGAELDALRGARDVIRAGRERLRLIVEMHPHLWGTGDPDARLGAVLDEFGLTATPLETPTGNVGPDQHYLLRCASR